MTDLRHLAFSTAFNVLHATRLHRAAAPWTRGLGAVLMFHHIRPWTGGAFAPNHILEITPDFLDATLTRIKQLGFDVIPIDALAERIAEGNAKRPFVVLTFDDGYGDNHEHALPVLRRHQAPFTIFATPGFADRTAPLWWLDLEGAIACQTSLVAHLNGKEQRFVCGTPAEKTAAYKGIFWALRKGDHGVLLAEIDRLARAAGLDPLHRTRDLCLDWAGLRAIAADPLCTIGAHTLTHPILAKLDANTARFEMEESKKQLEAALQRPIQHCAYPVGDPSAAGVREFEVARALGFSTGVTTRPGMIFGDHAEHLMALPRLSVNGLHQNRVALDTLLSGLPFALLNRGRRLMVS